MSSDRSCRWTFAVATKLIFRGACERTCRSFAFSNCLKDMVKVPCAYFLLMSNSCVAGLCACEFFLLKIYIRGHTGLRVLTSQFESMIVQQMPARQSDELKLVTHLTQTDLKFCNFLVGDMHFPIERRRTVVGQNL